MQKIKNYLPSFVYGGSDGAVSYFTLMAGAYGAGLPIKMLIAIGISNVCADAFSMASADYLSEDSKDINKNIKKGTRLSEEFTNASVTFFAFILLGIIPLIPTFYAYVRLAEDATLPLSSFLLSSLLTVFAFSFIGYIRGRVLGRNIFLTIMQSILICSASATVAYFIGEYTARILG